MDGRCRQRGLRATGRAREGRPGSRTAGTRIEPSDRARPTACDAIRRVAPSTERAPGLRRRTAAGTAGRCGVGFRQRRAARSARARHAGGLRGRAARPSTSRSTRPCSTSSRILRDEETEPKKFREVVRELSLAARLRGARRRARPVADGPDADRGDGGSELGRPHRPRADPAGRPRAWSTRCWS